MRLIYWLKSLLNYKQQTSQEKDRIQAYKLQCKALEEFANSGSSYTANGMIVSGVCPDCLAFESFTVTAEGGCSQNILCWNCGSEFNYSGMSATDRIDKGLTVEEKADLNHRYLEGELTEWFET